MRYTVAAMLAFALSACGTTTTPQPTLTPKPTPTVKQAAATAYLAAASKANEAQDAAAKLCPGDTPTAAQYKACFTGFYSAEQAFIQAVFAINFPSEMKSDVDALIGAYTQKASADKGLATSSDPNTDYVDAVTVKKAGDDAVAATSVVRHDLGLPPVSLGTPTPKPT